MTSTHTFARFGAALLAAGLALGPFPSLAQGQPNEARPSPVQRTEILDRAALNRLKRNSGVSLQWISWDRSRGHVRVEDTDGVIRLHGSQQQRNGPGRLEIDGTILRIDGTSFVFQGTVAIRQAPEDRAECLRNGTLHFRVTGTRRYWRLQEMGTCPGAVNYTDYVDIYF
jgi:hypothetical protein